jgi:putative sugar O-methyltransferase
VPTGGWKKVMDSAYRPLRQALESEDIRSFHSFLANFALGDAQTGIEESSRFQRIAASKKKREHFEQRVIGQLVHWWKTYESDGRELSQLAAPQFGNQSGFRVEGQLITPNAVFSDFYSRLLAQLMNQQRPTVAELGAGYGRLAYFLNKQLPHSKYLDFDLPEMLCCASYYLMLALPEKRFLLYGEQPLTVEAIAEHDIALMPAYELSKLPDQCLDLFLNENSLGVMPPTTAGHFVREMCRTSRALWHRNHEVRRNPFEDGTISLINREYPIDAEQFDLLVRYCDIERLIGNSLSTSKNDMVWYFYRRKPIRVDEA